MPAPQLITGALETAFNGLLSLDENSTKRLIPLQDKRMRIAIAEFPWPLIFAFSSRIDILIDTSDDATPLDSPADCPVDCSISLQLSTLNELRDSSQITKLIQEKRLQLEGDIHVAQHFSQLVKELDIDWEEHFSQYIGDVTAHKLFSLAKQAGSHLKQGLHQLGNVVKEGVVEEKKLLPHKIEVNKFLQDVNLLRGDVGRLEARLESLRNKLNR